MHLLMRKFRSNDFAYFQQSFSIVISQPHPMLPHDTFMAFAVATYFRIKISDDEQDFMLWIRMLFITPCKSSRNDYFTSSDEYTTNMLIFKFVVKNLADISIPLIVFQSIRDFSALFVKRIPTLPRGRTSICYLYIHNC